MVPSSRLSSTAGNVLFHTSAILTIFLILFNSRPTSNVLLTSAAALPTYPQPNYAIWSSSINKNQGSKSRPVYFIDSPPYRPPAKYGDEYYPHYPTVDLIDVRAASSSEEELPEVGIEVSGLNDQTMFIRQMMSLLGDGFMSRSGTPAETVTSPYLPQVLKHKPSLMPTAFIPVAMLRKNPAYKERRKQLANLYLSINPTGNWTNSTSSSRKIRSISKNKGSRSIKKGKKKVVRDDDEFDDDAYVEGADIGTFSADLTADIDEGFAVGIEKVEENLDEPQIRLPRLQTVLDLALSAIFGTAESGASSLASDFQFLRNLADALGLRVRLLGTDGKLEEYIGGNVLNFGSGGGGGGGEGSGGAEMEAEGSGGAEMEAEGGSGGTTPGGGEREVIDQWEAKDEEKEASWASLLG